MANSDWLSIHEVARLWGEESGRDAAALEADLEAWFAEFVERPAGRRSATPGSEPDAPATNRLMGLLGARHLERSVFEAYCRERGLAKPRFWFGEAQAAARGSRPPPPARPGAGREEPDGVAAPGARQPPGPPTAPAAQGPAETAPPAADAAAQVENLKTQLAIARRRIAELKADLEFRPAAPTARAPQPSAVAPPPGPPPPSATDQKTTTAEAAMRRAPPRRRRRLLATAAAAVVAVAIWLWGADWTVRLADLQPKPIPAEMDETTETTETPDTAKTAEIVASPAAGGDAPPAGMAAKPRPGGQASQQSLGQTAGQTAGQMAGQSAAQLATQLAAVIEELAAARGKIARLDDAIEASDEMVVRLKQELATARGAAQPARETPPADAASDPEGLTARLAESRRRAAELSDALQRANAEASELRSAAARAEAEASQADEARLAAEAAAAEARADLANAEAELAALGEQVEAAFESVGEANRIAASARTLSLSLRAENARLSDEVAAANAELAKLRAALEDDPGDGARPESGSPESNAAPGPEIEETLAAAELAPDAGLSGAPEPAPPSATGAPDPDPEPASGGEPATAPDQVAAVEATGEPETRQARGATGTSLTPDALLLDLAGYVGREVVVTGPVVWLLWRYRLQSDRGPGSLVIDTAGLRAEEIARLEAAVEHAGFLGAVRARIRGRVERETEATYRLAASELALVE
jgi:hypothetical protein